MRFNRLDLNHLVTLETLLSECNLTRAAERHHLTQPAVSNALTRLREYFSDELLVRHGRDMLRTPFAEQLLPSLRGALAQLQSVAFAKPGFEPSRAERTFRVVTSDYVAQVFLPEAIRLIVAEAPGVAIAHVPLSDETRDHFVQGECDALISPVGMPLAKPLLRRNLYTEGWACIARRGNRLVGDAVTSEQYFGLGRVAPSYRHYFIDSNWQAASDLPARPPVQLPFSAIPALVAKTDYVAILPERLVQMYEGALDLRRVALIPSPPAMQFVVHWQPEHALDPFYLWVLDRFARAGESLGAEAQRQ